MGASRWSFLSAWARRSPLHPGRATARREPSQGVRVRRICQLHPLDSSQQIRSVRPERRETPGSLPGAALAHATGMLARSRRSKSAHAADSRRRHSRPSRVRTRPPRVHLCRARETGKRRRNGEDPPDSSAGLRARAPAEGRRLGGEGSGGRKPLELLIGLGPPLPSPPRPRYRAARALTGRASTPNLPTSPS